MSAAIRTQLELPYQRATWQALLPQFLPGVDLFRQEVDVPLTSDIQRQVATGLHQIGRARLTDGKGGERVVAIFEVDVAPRVELHRNRVALRQLVARCIDEVNAHAVLAFFIQPGRHPFRLTYAARESVFAADLTVESRETATKRFTYVLGPGEPCRTAADRLAGLAAKRDQATLKDVTDAFSVEKLNDEFFETYRAHYRTFCDHLLESSAPTKLFGLKLRGLEGKDRDKALKPVRDFVKKLLGRLVFLHFLQKKGWLGCPKDRKDWKQGDPQFLKNLFDACADKNRFHSQALVPLFFDSLNNPNRPGDLFALTASRIPYLNGGLFERDFETVDQIDFPAQMFADLLEFFGQYNFTIDENDPDDHEIGIDPEMLGHIFENLLEDNKDNGAYYTPKPVVQYMCQQSLIHYLRGHFPGDAAAPAEIERLIRSKQPIDPKDAKSWVSRHAAELEKLLDEVKICDPAIGSGAFPIGLLQEIYWTRLTLHPALDRAKAKRDIIQKSIHGVDIDAGAVEIARLRCWLALIVEEDQPRPLPNLDYKIMQGDSLLESFEGIPLDKLLVPEVQKLTLIGGQREFEMPELRTQLVLASKEDRKRLTDLMDRYFGETDPARKAETHKAIDRAVRDHLDYNLRLQRERLEIELQQHKADIKTKKQRAPKWEPAEKQKKRMAWLEKELAACATRAERLRELEHRPERPFFLWHLFFQDVFTHGGFDIVIANPPYGANLGDHDFSRGPDSYEVASGNPDSYALFIELANRRARAGGVLCMIVPSGWYSGTSFSVLRRFLATATDPHSFSNLPYDVFSEAWVDTTIFVSTKRANREIWPRKDGHTVTLKTFPKRHRLSSTSDFLTGLTTIAFSKWFDDGGDEYLTLATEDSLAVLQKIKRNGRPLHESADVQRGVTPFHLTAKPTHRNSRAAFSGTIRRYTCTSDEAKYIRYDESLAEFKPERYFQGPRILLRELISRQFRLQATLVKEDFVTNKSMQSIVRRDGGPDLCYLLAVINSGVMSWYFLNRSNIAQRDDFPKIVLDETRNLPIPAASKEDQDLLAEKVARLLSAKRVDDDATAAALESEIDTRVACLFGLSAGEFSITTQGTVSQPVKPDAKASLIEQVLPGLESRASYFQIETVKNLLAKAGLQVSDSLLRQYMSEAMRSGVAHDAGRGWYSGLAARVEFDRKPVQSIARKIEKEFPLLDFTVWSTQQVNPWMHHLLAKFITFVHVDKDGLSAVTEFLRDSEFDVHENPGAAAGSKVVTRENTVVVRPLNAHAPRDGHFSPPEAVLVDLSFEVDRLGLMDPREFREMATRLARSGRLLWGTLIQYAAKRERTTNDLFDMIDPLTADM